MIDKVQTRSAMGQQDTCKARKWRPNLDRGKEQSDDPFAFCGVLVGVAKFISFIFRFIKPTLYEVADTHHRPT
jgi:hypothetical protein